MSSNDDDFLSRHLVELVAAEVQRRNPRTDGMVERGLAHEVTVEFANRLKAEYMTLPAQAYPDDPEQQRRMGIMIDEMFLELEEGVEKALGMRR